MSLIFSLILTFAGPVQSEPVYLVFAKDSKTAAYHAGQLSELLEGTGSPHSPRLLSTAAEFEEGDFESKRRLAAEFEAHFLIERYEDGWLLFTALSGPDSSFQFPTPITSYVDFLKGGLALAGINHYFTSDPSTAAGYFSEVSEEGAFTAWTAAALLASGDFELASEIIRGVLDHPDTKKENLGMAQMAWSRMLSAFTPGDSTARSLLFEAIDNLSEHPRRLAQAHYYMGELLRFGSPKSEEALAEADVWYQLALNMIWTPDVDLGLAQLYNSMAQNHIQFNRIEIDPEHNVDLAAALILQAKAIWKAGGYHQESEGASIHLRSLDNFR